MYSCNTCGTCRHWRKTSFSPRHGICAADAVEPDAGDDTIVLLSAQSGCWNHRDMWEPTEDYLEEVEQRYIPEWESNGVQPGLDFPATL